MENDKEKGKCIKCKFPTIKGYEYCAKCNRLYNNRLVISRDIKFSFNNNINFLILKLIEKFKYHDDVILSFSEDKITMANTLINETRHIGYVCLKRYEEINNNSPNEVRFIKAPLRLIPAVRSLKKERRWDD